MPYNGHLTSGGDKECKKKKKMWETTGDWKLWKKRTTRTLATLSMMSPDSVDVEQTRREFGVRFRFVRALLTSVEEPSPRSSIRRPTLTSQCIQCAVVQFVVPLIINTSLQRCRSSLLLRTLVGSRPLASTTESVGPYSCQRRIAYCSFGVPRVQPLLVHHYVYYTSTARIRFPRLASGTHWHLTLSPLGMSSRRHASGNS